MGFYKDSFRAMRSFLELTLFALSNFIEEDRDYFNEWLAGRKATPRLGDLLKRISANDGVRELNEKLGWEAEVATLYHELSGYIHTRGTPHTNTSLRPSNMTVFSETGMSKGVTLLLKTMRRSAESFVAVFPMALQPLPLVEKFAFSPPAGGFLDDGQVNDIRSIFEKPSLEVLTKICLSDQEVISLTEWVRMRPDVSEEEFRVSMIQTLESNEFASSKEVIIGLIKKGEIDQAVGLIIATQRAMMRCITSILYNPFHSTSSKSDTPKT